jgi:serine/threonine protein kinase
MTAQAKVTEVLTLDKWGRRAPVSDRSPKLHHHRFYVGQLLAQRFKILSFIAAGGMGEIYEAEDLELGEHGAIKAIHSQFLERSRPLAQFKREVHLARKVTHPRFRSRAPTAQSCTAAPSPLHLGQ